MAEKDLIPMNKRTLDEQKEITSAGGKASVKARRRKKAFKQCAELMMQAAAPEQVQKMLEALGVEDGEMTAQMGIALAMVQQALEGNVKAAQFLIDAIGQNPHTQLQREELKLKKQIANAAHGKSNDGRLEELIADLKEGDGDDTDSKTEETDDAMAQEQAGAD